MVYKAAFRLICFFYGMFAVASSAGEMPQDLRFLRVWHGRSVLDDTLPFPDGLTFVPAADYAADIVALPAELCIEDASGAKFASFAAPTNIAPPFKMHLCISGRQSPAVFAVKDGKTSLCCVGKWPEGFDPRRKEYMKTLAVRPQGGAENVSASLSSGVGQADVRFVTRGREGSPYIKDGRLFFTFSERFYGSACGVGSIDARHPESGWRFEGTILFDYGDGLLRNDLAPHIFYDDESREWRGWACNFSTADDKLSGRAKGGVNTVWSDKCPLFGLAVMRAKNAGLPSMNEDPCGLYDAKAGKWRLFVSRFTKSGIHAQILESDSWDGGYAYVGEPVSEDSTGTTIAGFGSERFCLSGSRDRAYYVYSYPALAKLGKLQMFPEPWGGAKGGMHGRGWPAFVELPDEFEYRHILLTMDRENFPGMPKPNWTYGGIHVYVSDVARTGASGQSVPVTYIMVCCHSADRGTKFLANGKWDSKHDYRDYSFAVDQLRKIKEAGINVVGIDFTNPAQFDKQKWLHWPMLLNVVKAAKELDMQYFLFLGNTHAHTMKYWNEKAKIVWEEFARDDPHYRRYGFGDDRPMMTIFLPGRHFAAHLAKTPPEEKNWIEKFRIGTCQVNDPIVPVSTDGWGYRNMSAGSTDLARFAAPNSGVDPKQWARVDANEWRRRVKWALGAKEYAVIGTYDDTCDCIFWGIADVSASRNPVHVHADTKDDPYIYYNIVKEELAAWRKQQPVRK